MQKSRERKVLESAVDAATDPAEKAELANKLSRLRERESRNIARSQRIRARAQAAAPAPAPVDDGAELFIMDWPANPAPAAQPAPAPEPRKEVQPAEPAPTTTVRRVLPVSGTGWTRTTPTFEPATWWDTYHQCWMGATETGAVRARHPDVDYSPESPELYQRLESIGSLEWAGGEFKNPDAEKRAEDEALRDYGKKMGWA